MHLCLRFLRKVSSREASAVKELSWFALPPCWEAGEWIPITPQSRSATCSSLTNERALFWSCAMRLLSVFVKQAMLKIDGDSILKSEFQISFSSRINPLEEILNYSIFHYFSPG